MSNLAYWEKRQKQLWSQLETDEKALTDKLSKRYDGEAKEFEKQIAYYYQKYGEDNVIQYRRLMEQLPDDDKRLLLEQMDVFAEKYPEYADLMPIRESIYKLNRLEGMRESIYIQQMQMGAMEQKELENHLKKQYERGYGAMAKEIGHGSTFNYVNQDVIRKTINSKWCEDKNFSERIWGNRSKLTNYLNNDFAAAMARGDSYERCISQLRKRFDNVSRRDMFNLIYTEGTYIMNEATITPFEEDYEEYQISIADSAACPICKGLVGKKFKIKDRRPGVNFPPLHTCCRCDKTIVIPDDFVDKYVEKHSAKADKNDIIQSGAITGARNPRGSAAKEHAIRYYGLVRKMKTDVAKIAKTMRCPEERIQEVKDFIFMEKHDLGGEEPEYFEPDYMMAESWKRLSEGKPEPHDITLMEHEIMERELMKNGLSQHEAHIKASEKYNYSKEANEFYGKIKKHKKE